MAALYVCMIILSTIGGPPDAFTTQLLSTMVRGVNTAEAFPRQSHVGLWFSMHISAALHIHHSAMHGQHTAT